MKRNKALFAGVSAMTLVLGLAACGGSDDEGGNDSFNEGGTAAGGKNASAVGPAPALEGAKPGGEMTVLAPDPDDGPTSLDPAGLWSVTDNGIAQDLLFRSLTTFRQNGKGGYELVPDLATDLGTPSEDFKTWTFTLKDGIKWENGKPVTAEEVAFGIKRSFDGDTFATGPGTSYSKPFFEGGEDYNGPYAKGAPADFPGVEVDGNKIVLHMAKPFPEMDFYSIFPAIGPVPLDAPAADYGLKPLSTGPYKIEKYTPNQELVLVKNENWDAKTDPARRQLLDKYTFKFGVDPTVAGKTVLSDSGKNTVVTALESPTYSQARKDGKEAQTPIGPQPCTSFVMPNYTKVKELEVRQALAYAYDYENVWAAGGEIPGVTRANGVSNPDLGFNLLPPGMVGRKVWNGPEGQPAITFDPAESKKLLKEAGYEPGQYEVSFVYDATTPQGEAAAEQRKNGYEESGFKVKMYPYTAGSLYDVWTNPDSKLYKKINLLGTAWCQDWPSSATFLPPIVKTGAAYNTGAFSEKAIDDQMDAISAMPQDEQAAAWGELEQKVMNEYQPVINTGFYNTIYGVGSSVAGFNNDISVGGAPDYRTMSIK
ncbi:MULTISPECIES: ABC transporter substrate-binding protein [unclassified Nocardioides]|uniref:ABC transporter substrate-binding protein n=1 Tax=unclassified Nocardioides TaxID=2615069 RepID=UPI0009E684CC|nr:MULTISPECIES: ABC transporter substrate-binding protein [unclassified Nocardioides]